MNFDPTDEQRLLAESIDRFVERDYGFETRRQIVASEQGWSRQAWSALADLGVLGLSIPEALGGFGGGAIDQMSVMEAIGRALLVEPYLATLLGAQLVVRGGSDAQRERILPGIVQGTLRMAFAHGEADARYERSHVATRAVAQDDGYLLNGTKRIVLHGPCADWLVVSARVEEAVGARSSIGLFLVEPGAAGVVRHDLRTLDGLRASDIELRDVRVDRSARLAQGSDAAALIDTALDYATALVCMEAAGAIRYANDATLEYLKTRKQFGVPIGSFQALQHRMVDMAIHYEQARSMAALACATVDAETDPVRRAHVVSAAKVRVADACRHVAQEAVQLHGGMGMSDELKISHTFRRLTMIAQQFGDADYHLARFAATH
jgi:alkylation response protein AidB-like acyl-CoA dehydrogenase